MKLTSDDQEASNHLATAARVVSHVRHRPVQGQERALLGSQVNARLAALLASNVHLVFVKEMLAE